MAEEKRAVYQYGRRSTDLSDKKKRMLSLVILFSMIAFVAVILLYSYLTQSIDKAQDAYIEETVSSSFDAIENYIGELSFNASQKASNLSQDIESKIREEYPDLSKLKKEMSQKDYTNLDGLISCTIQNRMYLNGVTNNHNSVFVTTSKDIIFNPDYDSSISDKSKYESWDSFINTNYNKELAREACKQLTTLPDSYIFIEPYKSDVDGHIYYKKVTIDTLRNIYKNEGIEGLRNYQLLVPAYIKNTKDIFDNPEVSIGIKHNTYRMIVIQRCNIYDQIVANKPYLINNDTDKLLQDKESLLTIAYGVGIIMVIAFISFIVLGTMLFNNFIIGKQEKPIIEKNTK